MPVPERAQGVALGIDSGLAGGGLGGDSNTRSFD